MVALLSESPMFGWGGGGAALVVGKCSAAPTFRREALEVMKLRYCLVGLYWAAQQGEGWGVSLLRERPSLGELNYGADLDPSEDG